MKYKKDTLVLKNLEYLFLLDYFYQITNLLKK